MGRLQQVIAELRRRRVFRALLGWAVVSFAVLQVVEPVMHGLDLPGWTLKAAIWALAAGFPIASVLAWIFDLGPGGVSRTPAGPVDPTGASPPPPRRLGLALASLVAVSILLGAGLAVVALRTVDGQSPQAPSIAVLPFADMSPGRDQEYFSDGVAEEILNALAQVEGLKVIGRTSSFSFKGRNEDLRVIGQRLGARALLEGSVRKDGARIRITAQLVRAADGSHLWSRTVDREFVDVFAVQSEIAQGVVEALRARLVPGPAVAPAERRVTSPEATVASCWAATGVGAGSPAGRSGCWRRRWRSTPATHPAGPGCRSPWRGPVAPTTRRSGWRRRSRAPAPPPTGPSRWIRRSRRRTSRGRTSPSGTGWTWRRRVRTSTAPSRSAPGAPGRTSPAGPSSSPRGVHAKPWACLDVAPQLGPLVDGAAPLTEYAWKLRHPAETGDPSRSQAEQAVALARRLAVTPRAPRQGAAGRGRDEVGPGRRHRRTDAGIYTSPYGSDGPDIRGSNEPSPRTKRRAHAGWPGPRCGLPQPR